MTNAAHSFTLETGVEIPAARARKSIYPFAEMEPGMSFVVPSEKSKTVYQAVMKYMKRVEGVEFTMRKVSDTEHRVWRVK